MFAEATIIKAAVLPLLLYAQQWTNTLDIPFPEPAVRFITQTDMANKVCESTNCDVRAWFSFADQTIYLRSDQNIHSDMYARSILLHEIVHHIQYHMGFPSMNNACNTWKAREIESYKVQYQWLHQRHVRVKTPTFNLPLVNFHSIHC